MDTTIYVALGVVAVIYIAVRIMSRKNSKDRKSRRFMEQHNRKENTHSKLRQK